MRNQVVIGDPLLDGDIDLPRQQKVVEFVLEVHQRTEIKFGRIEAEIDVGSVAEAVLGSGTVEHDALNLWLTDYGSEKFVE